MADEQYLKFQQDLAIQQALMQARQLGQQAAQVEAQAKQSQLSAIQQRTQSITSALDAVEKQKQFIKDAYAAEQIKQDSLSNQYNIMLTNIGQLRKSLVLDNEMFTRLASANVGELKADAAGRGVQAVGGSQTDLIGFTVDEVNRSAKNQQKRTLNAINEMADKALSLQVEKAYSKWNLDTQINFSNLSIKSELY